MGANTAPAAPPQSLSARTNTDLPITLCGCDLNGDPLSFRITTLPADGILYQFEDGARGAAIVAPNTAVADLLGRVIFRPAPDSLGNSQAGFRFIANDGEFDSVPGTIMISVRPLPIAPEIATSSWNSDDGFILRFSGSTTSIYRLWTSTNLLEWGVVGSAVQTEPGRFEFRSPATSDPTRFYKVSTP